MWYAGSLFEVFGALLFCLVVIFYPLIYSFGFIAGLFRSLCKLVG